MTGAAAAMVVAYEHATLIEIFRRHSDSGVGAPDASGEALLCDRDHIGFLQGVLDGFHCKRMVVERDFVDRDFLDDFAAYHVRSFRTYRRHCTRVHFFATDFSDEALRTLIGGGGGELTLEVLQDAYLGYCVIKPLPSTVVGRTAMRTYPDEPPERRLYPVTVEETVDLHGLALRLDTLPFQEQDRDVAACATSALWSVFHATGRRFQHAIPSPVQITNAASSRAGYEDRVLPNGNGLTGRQMADAIRSVGLEPYLSWLSDRTKASRAETEGELDVVNRTIMLKVAVAAYLRAGIPCLLLARMMDKGGEDEEEKPLGNHVVAVTGYRVSQNAPQPYGRTGILFAATRMSKLYAHDDQVGPFARMEFRDGGRLDTAQLSERGRRFEIVAEPTTAMLPLPPMVRIPFQQIVQIAIKLDQQVNLVREALGPEHGLAQPIEWDVQLTSLADFRAEMRAAPMDGADRLELMLARLPDHIWRLRACDGEAILFELLFDSTDLLQGPLFLRMVPIDRGVTDFFAGAIAPLDEEVWDRLPLETIRFEMKAFARRAAALSR